MPQDTFVRDETVILYAGTQHEQEVTYISNFIYKGERWFNIKLANGGYMETTCITKKSL